MFTRVEVSAGGSFVRLWTRERQGTPQMRFDPTAFARLVQEKANADRAVSELLEEDPTQRLLRVLTDPTFALPAVAYRLQEEMRSALLHARSEALPLAELAVLAARRVLGPPHAAPSRLRLITESLALAVEAELAFGSPTRAEHHLWEAVHLVDGSDAEPHAVVELHVALGLTSVAQRDREGALRSLRSARAAARAMADSLLDARLGLLEARLQDLTGEPLLAQACRAAAEHLAEDSNPRPHWEAVLEAIHLRWAVPESEGVQ